MKAALVRQVWRRADYRCEYCRIHQDHDDTPFEIDYAMARKHGGPTVLRNLALSCFQDNLRKGPNLTGFDPKTQVLTRLFNPRRHKWSRHFRWDGPRLVGKTPIGRTTVEVLSMNLTHRVILREESIAAGRFPPP